MVATSASVPRMGDWALQGTAGSLTGVIVEVTYDIVAQTEQGEVRRAMSETFDCWPLLNEGQKNQLNALAVFIEEMSASQV